MNEIIDIYELITEDELTPDLKILSSVCGLDNIRNMMKYLNGISFYIPKITKLDSFVFNYLNENRQKSAKELAKDLQITEQTVRNLRNRIRAKKKVTDKD